MNAPTTPSGGAAPGPESDNLQAKIEAVWRPTLGGPEAWQTLSAGATIQPAESPEVQAGGTLSHQGTLGGPGTLSGQGTLGGPAAPGNQGRPGDAGGGLTRYELLDELGRGGMGVVHRARQTSLRREVAIKRLTGDADPGRFVSEALVTGVLDHPNIVPVHELGQDAGGDLFLAMKMVGGRTWDALLHPKTDEDRERAGAMTREDHLGLLVTVCNAIAFAHSRGFIHRDLKPENVMVGEFGEVLVMDWGIALDVSDQPDPQPRAPHKTTIRGPAGTPSYMAPEMAEGQGERLGPATDVYLLGAMLHEVLTGAPPHTGSSLMAVLLAAAKSEPKRYPASVPAPLADICRRAMARDIAARTPTVRAFQSELEDYLRHHKSVVVSDAADVEAARLAGLPAPTTDAERDERYGRFSELAARYEQALEMWYENQAAAAGARQSRLDHARLAIQGGDFGLAEARLTALVARGDGEAKALDDEARAAREQREAEARAASRARWTVGILTTVAIIGLAGAAAVFRSQESKLARERDRAVAARDAARASEQDELAAKALAESKEKDARASKAAALKLAKQAEAARKAEAEQAALADKARREAEQKEAAAKASLAEAEQAAKAAEAARAKAEAERKAAVIAARDAELAVVAGLYDQAFAKVDGGLDDEAVQLLTEAKKRLAWQNLEATEAELMRLVLEMRSPTPVHSLEMGAAINHMLDIRPAEHPRELRVLAGGRKATAFELPYAIELGERRPVEAVDPTGKLGVLRFDSRKSDFAFEVVDLMTGETKMGVGLSFNAKDRPFTTDSTYTDKARNPPFFCEGGVVTPTGDWRTVRLITSVKEGRDFTPYKAAKHVVCQARPIPTRDRVAARHVGTLLIWDPKTGALEKAVDMGGPLYNYCFSPDGKRLYRCQSGISFATKFDITIHDVDSGRQVGAIADAGSQLEATEDGRHLLGWTDRTLKVWDVERERRILSLGRRKARCNWVESVLDGRFVACGGRGGRLNIWSLNEPAMARIRTDRKTSITAAAVSPSGTYAALGGAKRTAIHDADTGLRLLELDRGAAGIVFSPDESRVVLLNRDGEAAVFSMSGGAEGSRLTGLRGDTLAISGDGATIIVPLSDGRIGLFDIETGVQREAFDTGAEAMARLALSADGETLLAVSTKGRLSLWSLKAKARLASSKALADATAVAVSADGRRAAVASATELVFFTLDPKAAEGARVTPDKRVAMSGKPRTLAFVGASPVILVGNSGGRAELVDGLRGRVLSTLPLPYDTAPLVAASADGDRLLASCSEDGWTRLLQRSWSEALPGLGAKAAKARESLKNKPKDPPSWQALGDWFAHMGCGQAALDAWRRGGLTIAPARRAPMLLRAGKRKDAAKAWQAAAKATKDASERRRFELCARAAESGS